MTTILVTGGAGFIGSHSCKALRYAGFDPISYDNLTRGNPESVKWGALEIGDLTDGARLRTVIAKYRPAAVMHFAAFAYVGESNENPGAYYRNNVGGMTELLGAMQECGVHHIVFSSSCAIYGSPQTIPITEQNPTAPINPYGVTKMICERMLREYAAAFPLSFIALRYFNAAGADPDGEIGECHAPETHAIPLLLDAAAGEGNAFTIFGDDYPTVDGTCIRDYIHVSDLADAHVRAVRAVLDGAESTALNLGIGRGWSVRQLVDTALQIVNRDISVNVGPRRAGDPARLVACSDLIRAETGWNPEFGDLHRIVEHASAWRIAHPDGYGPG